MTAVPGQQPIRTKDGFEKSANATGKQDKIGNEARGQKTSPKKGHKLASQSPSIC